MKKIIAIMLSLLMMLSVIPFTAFAEEVKEPTDSKAVSEAASEKLAAENEELTNPQESLPSQSKVVSEQGETSGECGNNLTWSYDTTTATLTISGTGDMYDYNNWNYHAPWYSYRNNIKFIVISDSVTSIGDFAFSYCDSLTSVTIGNSVTSIGEYAFEYCDSLTSVNITDIDKWVAISFSCLYSNPLYYAGNLYLNEELVTEVVLSDIVTSIGNYAFSGCKSLTSVTIPDSVTSIGDSAFDKCTSLTSITIPDSVTSIGEDAFCYCTSLTSITIPDSVTSIGDFAFYYCRSLTSVTIGNSVTSIGESAFDKCGSLTSISIPSSVTSIGERTFSGCYSLTSVTIGNGEKSIGYDAFFDCYKLVEVINKSSLGIEKGSYEHGRVAYYAKTVHKGDTKIDKVDDYLFYTDDDGTNYLLGYVGNDTYLVLPENYKGEGYAIYDYAFDGCKSLTSITIGNGVTSIGSSAFFGCYKLVEVINKSSLGIEKGSSEHGWVAYYAKTVHKGDTKIDNVNDYLFYTDDSENYLLGYVGNNTNLVLPDNYKGESYAIYDHAFYVLDSLTSVIIPDSVTSIGGYAFRYCTSLTSVTIPDSVTSIGDWAFGDCWSLKYNTYDNAYYLGNPNNPFLYLEKVESEWIDSIIINENTKIIGLFAFSSCTSLTSVTIPDSVTSIGGYAFRYCTSLTSVTIGKSIKSIGYDAFFDCYKLVKVINKSSLDIKKGSGEHGYVAYYAKVVHNGDTKIDKVDDYLFYTDDDGTNYLLGYSGINPNLVLPENYKGENYAIYDYSFYNCDSLTSITIPDSVTSIGWGAFYECRSLTSITIGNSVTSIGDYAFYYCRSLTSVTIGNSVTSIGMGAFSFYDEDAQEYQHLDCDVYYAGSEKEWKKITGYEYTNYPKKFNYGHEHKLSAWSVTKKATCTTSGTQVRKCTVCKVTVNTKTIKATGHKLGSWTVTKKATCTAKGTQVRKCTVCKATVNTKTIKATGHKLGSWTTTKKATCTQKGTQVQKCKTCKKTINTKSVATVKHKLVYVAAKAATKTKKAVKAHYKCSVCKKEFTDKTAKKVFK